MSETANVMVEDRPTEVVSVDWTDEYRVVVHQRRTVEDYSIEQAEQLAEWLQEAAHDARRRLVEHLAENRGRMVDSSAQSGAEGVL